MYRALQSLLLADGVHMGNIIVMIDGYYNEPAELCKLLGVKGKWFDHKHRIELSYTYDFVLLSNCSLAPFVVRSEKCPYFTTLQNQPGSCLSDVPKSWFGVVFLMECYRLPNVDIDFLMLTRQSTSLWQRRIWKWRPISFRTLRKLFRWWKATRHSSASLPGMTRFFIINLFDWPNTHF